MTVLIVTIWPEGDVPGTAVPCRVRCVPGAGSQLATCHGPKSPSARQNPPPEQRALPLSSGTLCQLLRSLRSRCPLRRSAVKSAEVESFQRRSRGVPVDQRNPALLLRSLRPSADRRPNQPLQKFESRQAENVLNCSTHYTSITYC
jgi:hypothetical protein